MPSDNLQDALIDELRDLLHAEKQLVKALPKMAKAASDDNLRTAFENHLEETENQVSRLESALESLGKSNRTKPCEGMKGIIKEGEDHIKKEDEGPLLDAILIAAAQKVEHYEIALYGTLCAFAKQLGHNEAATLLHETLEEEKRTDEKLTELAKRGVNPKAAAAK